MKRSIGSIPQLYRNAMRWTEIASVLSKYGLSNWLSRFNIDFLSDRLKAEDGETVGKLTQSKRIRLALTELGPTFIKFGQMLSTRPDLIGPELADELSALQSEAPEDSFEKVREIIESEQGQTLEELFVEFSETPMASASIGQVHRAKVLYDPILDGPSDDLLLQRNGSVNGLNRTNGRLQPVSVGDTIDVVVKVRHDGIERVVETDLDILSGLAQLAERLDDFKNYQPVKIVAEMSRTMRRELDFERELRNLNQFRTMFEDETGIEVPKPIARLSSTRMLTMQFMDGTRLRDCEGQSLGGKSPHEIARVGANYYLDMIFNHGFYHADPHPGNILILENGAIGLLDFGMVGRISEQLREDIEAMLVAIVNQDVPMLTTLIKRVGRCPSDLNEAALSNDIADFVGQYSSQVISDFDMSNALIDFIAVVRQFKITLPSEASLLIKVLITLEGTGRLLNPDFSLMEIMKPFQRMLVLKRLSPARQVRKMRRFYMEMEQLVDALPQRVSNILEQIQTGRFDVNLEHRRLGPTANRLVVGLMVSALFLGSSLMLSFKVPPLFFPGEGPLGIQDLSFLGLTGVIVSLLMGFRLLWAIRKSGNLDATD
jgi:ubiquinone biosynthesis protein